MPTPWTVAGHAGRLYVADAGNHALRVTDLAAGRQATLPRRM